MTIGGKDERCYFFVIEKLEKRYYGKDIPTFTRHEAFRSWKHWFLTLYFVPYAGDFIVNGWSNTIVGATNLDFLPRPNRTIGVNMPFDTGRGIGKEENFC